MHNNVGTLVPGERGLSVAMHFMSQAEIRLALHGLFTSFRVLYMGGNSKADAFMLHSDLLSRAEF